MPFVYESSVNSMAGVNMKEFDMDPWQDQVFHEITKHILSEKENGISNLHPFPPTRGVGRWRVKLRQLLANYGHKPSLSLTF